MITIKEIKEKAVWENFLISAKPKTFLHSRDWGEFNEKLGNKVFYSGIYDGDELAGVALIIKIRARRGNFLFCPHGPIVKIQNEKSKIQNIIEFLAGYLKNLAEKENCGFIRISPLMLKTPENEKIFKDSGFRKAPIHMHAELVWVLDLKPTEEELLKNMRKNTRYYIRKAVTEGIKIVKSKNLEDIKIFEKLYSETANRHHFVPFGDDYLKKEFESFVGDNQASLFFAEYNGEIVAGAMIIFCGDSAFYHHGASSLKYPKSSAPYFLQWEIIREAKNRGCQFYNFWGIAPENKPNHPWAGLTFFKKGFGGFSEEYVPAQDFALKYSYWFVYLIEKIRKIKRNL